MFLTIDFYSIIRVWMILLNLPIIFDIIAIYRDINKITFYLYLPTKISYVDLIYPDPTQLLKIYPDPTYSFP